MPYGMTQTRMGVDGIIIGHENPVIQNTDCPYCQHRSRGITCVTAIMGNQHSGAFTL